MNKLPAEFLQKVSQYLQVHDYYQCLLVNRCWHHTFQRELYKKIDIYFPNQLEQLVETVSNNEYNAKFIKELRFHQTTTDDDAPSTFIVIDQKTFDLFNKQCSSLQVLNFNMQQWNNLQLSDQHHPWKQMKSCPPVEYTFFSQHHFSHLFASNLTTLYVSHLPEQLLYLIDIITQLKQLKEVTLEMRPQEELSIPFSTYIEKLHLGLPKLSTLNLIRTKTPNHESNVDSALLNYKRPTSITSLLLNGHIDSIKWFQFIANNYPNLTKLELTQLSTSRFGTKWMWQQALIELLASLPHLKVLSLGGRNVPQLFSKSFVKALEKPICTIQDVYIDFETYQAIESCQFLLVVASCGIQQLRKLRLRVWEQIPGWSGVTSNLFQCKRLISLELSLSKGLMDQFSFTPFLIDHFLNNLPQLEELTLTGAKVQVTYNNYCDLDFSKFALKKLDFLQCKVENHDVVFKYLASCCHHLEQVLLKKCETDKVGFTNDFHACTMDLQDLKMDKLVLCSQMVHESNEFIGVNLILPTSTKITWCHYSAKGHYSLCQDEQAEELNEIYQHSIDVMPGLYHPTIGFFTIRCQSIYRLYLDHIKIK